MAGNSDYTAVCIGPGFGGGPECAEKPIRLRGRGIRKHRIQEI